MVASPSSSTTASETPRKKRIPTSRLAASLLAVAGLVLALAPTIQADIIPPIDYTGSYRLAFVTSTTTTPVSADIGTYNTFVTNAAAAITELDDLNTTWKVIGSTLAVSAKENTGTYITSDGSYNAATDVPIYTTTGKLIALNNDALWGGSGIANPISFDDGTEIPIYVDHTTPGTPETWTGTNDDGSSDGDGTTNNQDQNALGTGPIGPDDDRNYITLVRGGGTTSANTNTGWINGPSDHDASSKHFMALSAPITGVPAVPFAITAIDYDPDADTVTLTWTSRPNTLYRVIRSTDLSDWTNELVDSIGSEQDENTEDGAHITFSFDLVEEGLDSETDLFFRVEEQPQ